jgi:aminoglycoside phosphotransferase (APT) family kinase protein
MHDKLGSKIAEGGCSEVFEWENKRIIKLAKDNTDLESMRKEYDNNRIAWDIGLSVAQPFELLDIDGRPGIVFERIYGQSLMERFMIQVFKQVTAEQDSKLPNIEENDIRITAQVLSEIHKKSNLKMSSQRESIKYSIRRVDYLTHAEKEAVINILDSLPAKQQLCHGDPNPGNIMMRDGKAVIIDWMNASIGNPEADLAEYIIMIRYGILPSSLPSKAVDYFNSLRELIISVFISEYMQLSGITYDEIDPWILPIAANKLAADVITEDEKDLLIKEIRRRLNELKNTILGVDMDGYLK